CRGWRVFAVHPSYPLRTTAWRQDLAALAERATTERPDVMLGDFNATWDHRPFRHLLAAGYRDAAAQSGAGWQPTWPVRPAVRPAWMRLSPSVTIDHVLVGAGLVAASTRTARIPGTDHKALVASLVVGRSPGS
ncbi:endonuclease/exonuclease/phosphatase family protein, partial [Nocardioides sp. CER28]